MKGTTVSHGNGQETRGSLLRLSILLLFLSLASSSSAVTSSSSDDTKPSAYEVLESYNFPIGLLPQGCSGYDLDPDTGEFSAYFNNSCSFSLEGSYQLRYQSTISGRISSGRLSDLRGVTVKIFLFWINIIEVSRDGDDLEFSVGIASADFPIDNFYECPQCGCGLDCVTADDGDSASSSPSRIRLRGAWAF
ncbi:uncharacterized protein [Elaeis guineensis]|uniref:Uncharacterized protein LOC105045179 n=1 Tax=Elaeis guineensis var. tenera TaxID=51953 RepID=A0A6I9R7C0_ELAGV|nr:uncharacterized protein LOC105045179 [Elaeis guineensis]